MKTYLVQDSDWDWQSHDGDAIIIQAETPEEAAIKWGWHWATICNVDGACVKIAEIRQDHIVMFGKNENGQFEIDKD